VISMRRSRVGCSAALILAMSLLILPAPQANASPETLKRGVSNILNSPLDLVLSPMSSAIGMTTKMRDVKDSVAIRVFFALPGYIWYTGVNVGASVIRAVTGMLELVPGILLLPFDADLDPLFDAVENAGALVEVETPCCIYIKFGIDYTSPEG
jgi:hypothetical protein